MGGGRKTCKGKGKEKDKASTNTSPIAESPATSPDDATSLTDPLDNLNIDPKDCPARFPNGDSSIDLAAINLALGLDVFGRGNPSIDAVHGGFPNVFHLAHRRRSSKGKETLADAGDGFSPVPMQRQGSQQGLNNQQQPPSPGAAGPSNGVAPAMNGMPAGMLVHAGQQMDINYIHTKLAELSEQHRANRAQTQQLIASTEQLARRAVTSDAPPNLQEASAEIQAARAADSRIAELTQKLSTGESLVKVLKREQRENAKLIGEYEQALDKVVGMLRDFAAGQTEEKTALARRYLNMLQAERDEHLQTRFEKDQYVAKILDLQDKIRTAYRLRCEESLPDVEIIAGLQNEVRAYRAALGMEPERFEDEFGYPVLRNVKNGAGEP